MELPTDGRCPKCKTALEKIRDEYHCPTCTFKKLLTHKRHDGMKLKVGYNMATSLKTNKSIDPMAKEPFTRQEIDDICNIKYNTEFSKNVDKS